jgi:hypothetical protein
LQVYQALLPAGQGRLYRPVHGHDGGWDETRHWW